jgi:hypothetical protein
MNAGRKTNVVESICHKVGELWGRDRSACGEAGIGAGREVREH